MKTFPCIVVGIAGLIFFVGSNLRMNQIQKEFNGSQHIVIWQNKTNVNAIVISGCDNPSVNGIYAKLYEQ